MRKNLLRAGLARYFTPSQLEILHNARVGVAGAGGLGSNAAQILVRSGIENLRLIDHDRVEESNLNRQHYWPRHVGQYKVEALAENLLELNPDLQLDLVTKAITEDNLSRLLEGFPLWVEALDNAGTKAMFVNRAVASSTLVVSASGLCGIGGKPMAVRHLGGLYVVGDYQTGMEKAPPFAPRVLQAAAMMADCLLAFLLEPPSINS